jgi:hypothetical protein
MTEIYEKKSKWYMPGQYQFSGFDRIGAFTYPASGSGDIGHTSGANHLTGTYLPGWKSIIRSGQGATTALSGDFTRTSTAWLSAALALKYLPIYFPPLGFAQGRSLGTYIPLQDYGIPAVPSHIQSRVENRAISKFISNSDSIRSAALTGEDLGEISQTLRAITNPLGSLRQLTLGYFSKLTKAKRLARGSKIGLRTALSDSYLEYRFGWRPLASDIAGAYEHLIGLTDRYDTQRCRGSAEEGYYFLQLPDAISVANPLVVRYLVNSTAKYAVTYLGGIRTGVDERGRMGSLQAFGLDLPHLIPTAWNLIPYSFVVDYFVNIGDIISAASWAYSNCVWLQRTVRYTMTSKAGGFKVDPINPNVATGSTSCLGGNSVIERTTFLRQRHAPSTLVPTLQFNLPVSSRPWKNIAALISSNVRSLVPFFR